MKSTWPLWRIVMAYALLAALAVASIWFVDQRVHHQPSIDFEPATTKPAR